MSRQLVIAVLLGAGIGLVAFLASRPESTQKSAPVAAPEAAPENSFANVFTSPASPGLIVHVSRNTTPEPAARIELFRVERDLSTEALAWRPAGTESSDRHGTAHFPALAGRYLVLATATDGARAMKTLDVGRALVSTQVSLTFEPLQHFAGTVTDARTHQPLANATVRADPSDTRSVAISVVKADAFGRFALDVPSAPHWRLQASAPGFLPDELIMTAAASELELSLVKGVQLEGTVVDPSGAPISNATIRTVTLGATTDAAGKFSLVIPHGPVSIHALALDGRQALQRIVTTDTDERATVKLVVTAGTELTGVVRDESGPAIADVRVLAEPESLELAALQTTADGHFTAKGLPPGRYSVRAQRGVGRRASAVGVELPGAAPIELTLSSAGRLVGAVVDGDNQPLHGATVTVSWPDGLNEVDRTAMTDEAGHYDFDDLMPSTVTVQAHLADTVSIEVESYVAPGITAEVNLTVAAQGRLVGIVESKAINEVLVRGVKSRTRVKVVDGRFEQLLAPGEYHLYVLNGEHMFDELTATVRPGELTTVTLTDAMLDGGGPHRKHTFFDLSSGISFENSPGGVRVDFLMGNCPAAKAGLQMGDLVLSIEGEATQNALGAFEQLRKSEGDTLSMLVRRDGRDLPVVIK
jgi:Carboxypeptidase regulatory-like domain/PDZ domain